MAKFLKSKAKLITLIYLVIVSLIFLYAVTFMTKYAHIHVFYGINGSAIEFKNTSTLTINQQSNSALFRYFQNINSSNPLYSLLGGSTGSNAFVTSGLAQKVYDFQMDMNKFNDQLIVYGCVSVVLLICMFVASNHNRKIYYKSNLIIGVAVPAGITIYTIIMLVKELSLLKRFNENSKLFRTVSYLQNGNYSVKEKNQSVNDWKMVMDKTKDVNNLTFILGIVLFIVIIIYSVFMIVYTFYRFKECSKRRAEIIERAAKAND